MPPILEIGVGYVAASVAVPYGKDVAVVGFPFAVTIFVRRGAQWIDYVSEDMTLAFLANCAVGVAS